MISKSTDFNTLLDRAGMSSSGRDIFDWTADFTRDPEGRIILPSNSPTGAELQAFLKNNILPEVNGALDNLSKVNSSFETIYKLINETGSGAVNGPNTLTDTTKYWGYNEWVGYKLLIGGIEYTITGNTGNTITVSPNWTISPGTYNYKIFEVVEIDYGDVLILKGSLYFAKGGITILSAYNVNIDIDTIVSLYKAGTLNFQNHIINTYTQLLTLLPDQQLSQAKSAIREAINIFNSAINFIKAETDPQDNDLFIIDDPVKEQRYRDLLADLNSALNGTTLIRKIGYQVNLAEFFDNPKTLRNYLPTFRGQYFIQRGTYPDPTFGGILPNMTASELDEKVKSWGILAGPLGILDFNGDGKTDILWRNKSTGQNVVWLMNGVTWSSSAEALQVADTNWQIVGTGDFNGDGKTDILWRNKSTGQNVVWLMNGVTWSSSAAALQVADTNWEIVGTGDFNGDGKTDILWRNKATGENVVWYMDGVTRTGWPYIEPAVSDLNWEIVGTGDFNGDGKTDILWRNKTTGQNVVWLMNGVVYSSYAELMQVTDTNWQIVGTGDFNSDGKVDILWRNKSTGQNIVWLMDGVTYSNYAELYQVTDTNWEIVGPK